MENKERQDKEVSINMFKLEESSLQPNDRFAYLVKAVKPLILDGTITYDEWKDDIVNELTANLKDATDDTIENRTSVINTMINNLIEKYKKIRYERTIPKDESEIAITTEEAVNMDTENAHTELPEEPIESTDNEWDIKEKSVI